MIIIEDFHDFIRMGLFQDDLYSIFYFSIA